MTDIHQMSTLTSKLFADMVDQLDPGRNLRILDFGPAMPETVEFFSRFRCRLQFADLYTEPDLICQQKPDPENPVSESQLQRQFEDSLGLTGESYFDLCLFWDFLNFLDGPSVRALGRALAPCLHSRSLGHGFGVLNLKTRLVPQQYSILDQDLLSFRPRFDSLQARFPHSQSELDRLLECFEVSRRLLLGDGRMEILLRARF